MSVIEIDPLLTEISAEAPAGAEVEYDPEYFELEKLAQGTPESTMGDEVKPAEEPVWKDVKAAAFKLFERTRDLRVAMILTVSLLQEDGLPGFQDGVAVVKGFVEKLWDQFYPKLDPDDNNDPTIRVNILKGFDGDGSAADPYKFKQRLREATLTNSQQRIGKFSYRDIQVAKGEVQPPVAKEGEPDPKLPDLDLINAAFQDTTTEDLQATQATLQAVLDDVSALNSGLEEKVGAGNGPDLSGLKEVLGQIQGVMQEQLAKRGIGEAPASTDAADDGGVASGGPISRGAISGEISSRSDVIRMLDKICAYYDQYEPTSPVPIFMKRAKKLVTMSFVDLMKELAPEAMAKIEVFTGEPASGEGG
jgi:type VI secretion system protein ImpA